MKNIGFYVHSNRNDFNFNDWLNCNPGVGGTFYLTFSLIIGLLSTRKYKIVLFSNLHFNINDENLVQIFSKNLSDAINLFDNEFGGVFIFSPRNKTDISFLPIKQTKLISWGHCLYGKGVVNFLSKNDFVFANVFLSKGHSELYSNRKLLKKSIIIGNFTQNINKKYFRETNDSKNVCFIGSLYPFKHFDYLLSCWHKVLNKNNDAKLYVIGSSALYNYDFNNNSLIPTSYEKEIKFYIEKNNLVESVSFLGLLNSNQIFDFISKNISVGIVNPVGTTETFCTSAIEFGSVGIPVISGNYGGLKSTIAPNCGFKISSKRMLVSKINKLLVDKKTNHEFGLNYQEFVSKNFSFKHFLKAFSDLIDLSSNDLTYKGDIKFNFLSFVGAKFSSLRIFLYRVKHHFFKKFFIK